jgi:hypothetical protein
VTEQTIVHDGGGKGRMDGWKWKSNQSFHNGGVGNDFTRFSFHTPHIRTTRSVGDIN